MVQQRSQWDAVTLADMGQRLRDWALGSVPFAQQVLDRERKAPWRDWSGSDWHREAQGASFLPASAPPPRDGSVDSLRWFKTLRETVDLNLAKGLLSRNLPGMSPAAALAFLQKIQHPAALRTPGERRAVKRLLGDGRDQGDLLAGMARESGTLQGELSILFQWLSGKADRTGTRMAGPPVCGSQPRCSECPLVAYCSTARVPVEVVYSRSESCASAAAAYSPVEPAPPAESPTEPPTVRIIDLPQEQRPRERLMRGDTLDAMELLAIIIKSGTMNHSALDVARLVMRRFPTLTLLKDAGIDDLAAIPGMGAAKAATVKAALELGKRVHWNGGDALPPEQNESLTSAKLIFQRYAPKFLGLRLEMFYMVALDTRLRPIREVEVATGNINSVPIHPREVFNEAIKARAYKVLLMHNHPGADPTPSASDRHVTTRLAEAGQVLGIPVMDHVIIAGDRFFSFFENGLMPSPMP